MLIRRNLPLSKNTNRQQTNDLIPLRERQPYLSEEDIHLIHYTSHTLNPQNPIRSVLVHDKISHGVINADKQDSEFSFKQKGLLTQQDPQNLEELNIFQQKQKTANASKATLQSPLYSQARKQEDCKPIRYRRCAGMLTNHFQLSSSKSQASESADTAIRKPINSSLGSSRLKDALNKIKYLRIAPAQVQTQPSQRYSTVKNDESKVESTETSGEDASPIKKTVISNIRKHVQRMNLSLAKDHRIKQQQSDNEEQSLIFNITNERKSKNAAQELLQSKNKSFLVRSTNKKQKKQSEGIVISYKTSILELKELCERYDESVKLKVSIPISFLKPLCDPSDEQENIFGKALTILHEIGVTKQQHMTIRKYSNCVIVLIDELAILSYFSGHVYFGGWHEGSKNGLGLEWSPNRYVYYGQFSNNKRDGYGVLKDQIGEVFLGEWRENRLEKNVSSHSKYL